MLDTHVIQLILYSQVHGIDHDVDDLSNFIEDVRKLANRHNINLEEYETIGLPNSEYKIRPCDRCRELTIDHEDLSKELLETIPRFLERIRKGKISEHSAICQTCETALK